MEKLINQEQDAAYRNLLKNLKQIHYVESEELEKEIVRVLRQFKIKESHLHSVLFSLKSLINDHSHSVFLKLFVKLITPDPLKKNLAERIVIQRLNQIPNNTAKKTNSPTYIVKNKKVDFLKTKKPIDLKTKSIDFEGIFNDINYFGWAKYIKSSGGSQDNQFNDVKHTISSLQQWNECPVLIVCDGQYFTAEKLEILESINFNEHIFLSSYDTLEKTLEEFPNHHAQKRLRSILFH